MSSHAAHETHAGHGHHAVTHDTAKAGNLAVFLGLVAFTFFTATAVGANVYLRAWSPSQFTLTDTALKDFPYYNTLLLLINLPLLLLAGHYFRVEAWRKFNGVLALIIPLFLLTADQQYWIVDALTKQIHQIQTAYLGPAIISFVLCVISCFLLLRVGLISRAKQRVYFPVCMNVWLYTIFACLVIMLLTDVISFTSIGAWCGTKLASLADLGR